MLGITKSDVIVALGALALGVVCFLWASEHGAVAEREKHYMAQIETYQKDVVAADKVARDLESKLAALSVARAQLEEALQNELARDPVYRDCVIPKNGIKLLNQAIRGEPL